MPTSIKVRGEKPRNDLRKKKKKLADQDPQNNPLLLRRSQRRSFLGQTRLPYDDSHNVRRSEVATPQQSILSPSEPRLSSFEKLPLELLQEIFFLSLNFNLPQASPAMQARLSSEHVKTKLVMIGCTGSQNIVDIDLQSSIFELRWMTYAFLQRCQKIYYKEVARRQYPRLVEGIPDEIKALDIIKIEKYIDLYFDMGENAYRSKFYSDRGAYFKKKEDGDTLQIQLDSGGTRLLFIQNTRERDWAPFTVAIYQMPYNPFEQNHHIPGKLVRGPWTQAKGDFLKMFLDNCRWPRQLLGEIAEQALTDAVRHNNPRAINAFIGRRNFTSEDRYTSWKDEVQEQVNDYEQRVEIPPDGPWIRTRGKCWNSVHSYTCPVNEEHVRVAILEAGCDKSTVKELVKRLNYDRKREISGNSDLALAFVRWGRQQQDLGNEIGSWLLEHLDIWFREGVADRPSGYNSSRIHYS